LLFPEKQASETTRPAKNGCVLSTPVSRIATTLPAPVRETALASFASTNGVLTESTGLASSSICNEAALPLASSADSAFSDKVSATYGT
jgi:hypothetical protein